MLWKRMRIFEVTPERVRRQAIEDARDREWRWWPPRWPFVAAKPVAPPADQAEPALFEEHIREFAEEGLRDLEASWHNEDLELKRAYCTASDRLGRAREKRKKESGESDAAAKAFEQAQAALQGMKPAAVSALWKWIGLIAIGVTEFPLNAMIFRIIGERDEMTYLLAAGIGLVIPLTAHFFGHSLRQDIKTLRDKYLLAAIPVALVLALVGIATLRAKFFAAEAEVIQEELHINLSSGEAATIFFALNLAMFLAAVLISYFGSVGDTESNNQKTHILDAARRALSKESAEAQAAGRELDEAEATYQKARATREKTFLERAALAEKICETAEGYMRQYRFENVAARRDGKTPPCFRKDPARPNVPPDLKREALSWDCPSETGNADA